MNSNKKGTHIDATITARRDVLTMRERCSFIFCSVLFLANHSIQIQPSIQNLLYLRFGSTPLGLVAFGHQKPARGSEFQSRVCLDPEKLVENVTSNTAAYYSTFHLFVINIVLLQANQVQKIRLATYIKIMLLVFFIYLYLVLYESFAIFNVSM